MNSRTNAALASTLAWVIALAMATAAPSASAQGPSATPFSADMKLISKRAGAASGKIDADAGKTRMEMNMQGHEAIMIFDVAKNAAYMLMPKQKMYMEMRADNPNAPGAPPTPKAKPMDPNNPCAGDADMTCKKTGTETVNGRNTDKWEFTPKGGGETFTAWVDQKLHFPVKTQNTGGDMMELTNIQEGAQPASLFEVPPGYQKFDMDNMMKGRPR